MTGRAGLENLNNGKKMKADKLKTLQRPELLKHFTTTAPPELLEAHWKGKNSLRKAQQRSLTRPGENTQHSTP